MEIATEQFEQGATDEESPENARPAKPPRGPRRKKRRVRSPHPGVKLKQRTLPSGGTSWRAVFVDPDTGRETYVTLDTHALPTLEMRRAWAIAKSRALAKRRMQIESGAPKATGTELGKAIAKYFDAHTRLRPRTREIYRRAADKLEAWAEKAGVQSADDLDRAKLMAFREAIVKEPKRAPVKKTKGGRRGAFAETKRTRSAAAINQELRSVRTVLGYLHDADLLPKLSFDDLRRGLKLQKALREAPEFLEPAECRKLLEAALRHDADTYAETRAEHRGERKAGTTERYDAIAPFVAFVLLTGCRAGEALNLRWADVKLDALDADGQEVGEVRLRATAVKTGAARKVSLDVSPTVRTMLAGMKLRADDAEYVFGGDEPQTRDVVEAARRRLIGEYGAPRFTWQLLRSTVATYQCNAPGLFGDAAAFRSAKRLGHSVVVSEKRYAEQFSVSREARTLEQAMQIERQMAEVVTRVSGATTHNTSRGLTATPARGNVVR